MTTVWQIAAGDSARDYSQMLIEHDVMIMGPGEYGSAKDGMEQYEDAINAGWCSSTKARAIERFYTDVKPGHFVLLRRGHRVVAFGLVEQDTYEWDERFDDVYGWDLQHSRRILWQDHLMNRLEDIQRETDLFSQRRQIPTFTRVRDESVLSSIRSLFPECRTRPHRPLPDPPSNLLHDEQLGEGLFSRGLSLQAVDSLLTAIGRQRRLLKWYYEHGVASGRPTEHEVVAYMVLPMLLSLGWSEQLLAIEWHKVDLAAFRRIPTVAEVCALVCEAKGMWHGLQGSLAQAARYVADLGLTNCRKVMLTQGGRFYLFDRLQHGATWNPRPSGYFNVEKIRRSYVVPLGTDALESMVSLMPASLLAEQ